jgi:LysM repeat protein
MKDHSPLVPQGSFEAQARGKSRVKLAFYTIVVVHVLAIAGFLIIGCKREDKDAGLNAATATNETPVFGSDPSVVAPTLANTNPPVAVATSPVPANVGLGTSTTVPPAVVTSPPPPVVTDLVPAAEIEHTIVKNDTFGTLATKYGVSVKAIQAANPNVSPNSLKIGSKVKIPAKTATMARTSNGTAAASDAGDSYTVKSGDTLSKIASSHRTTIRELQKLNNLPTTQIKVGQKLKMPPKPVISPGAAASSGTAVPAGTVPPAQ